MIYANRSSIILAGRGALLLSHLSPVEKLTEGGERDEWRPGGKQKRREGEKDVIGRSPSILMRNLKQTPPEIDSRDETPSQVKNRLPTNAHQCGEEEIIKE